MPAKNRYAFLLNQKGDVAKNVNDIYTQLQAPAQRAAVESSLNASLKQSAPTTRKVEDGKILVGFEPVYGGPIKNSYGELVRYLDYVREIYETAYRDQVVPSANPVDYATASARAANAAYAKTINPNDLLNSLGRERYQIPGYIENAYINPAAEGAYDVNPLFDSSGQQLTGIRARPQNARTRPVFDELDNSELSNLNRYNNTLSNTLSAYTAAVAAATAANRAAISEHNRTAQSDIPTLIRVEDPEASYNLQRASRDESYQQYLAAQTMQGNSYGISFLPGGGTGPGSFYQTNLQIARDAAINRHSNTPLSASFYKRGGHDNPSSFPSGTRL